MPEQPLFDAEAIKKINAKPGDTLLVTIPEEYSPPTDLDIARIQEQIQGALGDVHVLVTPPGFKLQKIDVRPDAAFVLTVPEACDRPNKEEEERLTAMLRASLQGAQVSMLQPGMTLEKQATSPDAKKLAALLVVARQALISRGLPEDASVPHLLTTKLLQAITELDPSPEVNFRAAMEPVWTDRPGDILDPAGMTIDPKLNSRVCIAHDGLSIVAKITVDSDNPCRFVQPTAIVKDGKIESVTLNAKPYYGASILASPLLHACAEAAVAPMGHYRSLLPEKVRNRERPNPEIDWNRFENQASWYDHNYGEVYLWLLQHRFIDSSEVYVLDSAEISRHADGWCMIATTDSSGAASRHFAKLGSKEIIHVAGGKIVGDGPPVQPKALMAMSIPPMPEGSTGCKVYANGFAVPFMKVKTEPTEPSASSTVNPLTVEDAEHQQTWRDRPPML